MVGGFFYLNLQFSNVDVRLFSSCLILQSRWYKRKILKDIFAFCISLDLVDTIFFYSFIFFPSY